MKKIQELLEQLRRDEKGATVIEYALIAALIAVVAIGVMGFVGNGVKDSFEKVNSALTTASSTST